MLKVGAATEVEMKEKKARVEDSVHALRAAMEEGVVPGGGVALARAMKAVSDLKLPDERKAGAEIVARAMGEPLRQIAPMPAASRRWSSTQCAKAKVITASTLAPSTFEELDKAGVIDPAKVVRSALENAVSAAAICSLRKRRSRRSLARRRLTVDASGRRDGWNARHGWNGRNGRHGRNAREWAAWVGMGGMGGMGSEYDRRRRLL